MLIRRRCCLCCLPAHFHFRRGWFVLWIWSWSALTVNGVDVPQLLYAGTLMLIQRVSVLVERNGRIGVAQEPGKRYHVHPLLCYEVPRRQVAEGPKLPPDSCAIC